MKYKINWDGGVFAVPDIAADRLKLASGKAAKILLYFLKYRTLPDEPEDIGVTAEDIEDALSYWEQVGVLYKDAQPQETPEKAERQAAVITQITPAATVIRPQKSLLPREISERVESSEEIAFLFKSAEGSLGRLLTFDDQRTILWIYDHLGLPADIIIMLIAYCCSIERRNMAYIEKIAVCWQEKNISTHEQAENEILLMQKKFSFEGRVKTRLQLQNKLTASQKKYIGEWALLDIDIDMVELAYDKTVDATGKPAFGYMNKILQKWHDNGITTVQGAQEFDERTRPAAPKSKGGAGDKNGRDPDEPSFDLSLILEHAKNNTPTV